MNESHRIITAENYEKYVGPATVERVLRKARPLRDYHIVSVNSTYYGGGVAEILSSKTLLLNSLGIKTGWRIIQGSPDFFSITKKMHNALQGSGINLSKRKREIYESVVFENAVRNHLDHDIVLVHDPQPLPLINHYRKRGPWIWRCHIDLTRPDSKLWSYLLSFIKKYDAVVLSLEEYARRISKPQLFFLPAINPFSLKNRELSEEEIDERLAHYGIPTDLPLVVQVSRFDRWKDPEGVVRAFKIARKQVGSTLVLLGNVASDDPEGPKVYESLMKHREERILILSHQDSALVNALQRRAAVVLQKSLREGFGLTVTEAMWKGTPVIGGNAGGIRRQIEDGVNGFLVSSVREAADRIVLLLKDKALRETMGKRARETVAQRFLMIRLVEQYLDLFNSFEANYRLAGKPGR
ncbi:MAG: glycosyltransferase [Thermodesulfovibrionales bacterium]